MKWLVIAPALLALALGSIVYFEERKEWYAEDTMVMWAKLHHLDNPKVETNKTDGWCPEGEVYAKLTATTSAGDEYVIDTCCKEADCRMPQEP